MDNMDMLGYVAAGLLLGLILGLVIGAWRTGVKLRASDKAALAATESARAASEQRVLDARAMEQAQARQQALDAEARMRVEAERQLQAAADAATETASQTRELLIGERNRIQQERDDARSEYRTLTETRDRLALQLEREETERRALEQRMAEKQRELVETQERLRLDFENLANRIFEEKNKSFQEQSRKEINDVVTPLRERILEFQQNINRVHVQQSEQGAQLKEQILGLTSLNKDMLQDARNLTNALKGDSKVQGNWGEMILESVLEKSGLEKGREYVVQASATNEEGRRLQPDVVLHLPGDKVIVLDSKVSLTAYERYTSSDDPAEQQLAARAHLESVRNHFMLLSAKDYPSLYGMRSQDFVLMFIPIEPAFGLALRQDDSLYMKAFSKNVVLVTPSTLLATLRTIKHIWNQENQSRNVMMIASEAGKLHDKFVLLIEDLKKIGINLDRTQSAYQDSFKKLSEGHGNLIRRVDMLRQLGAKVSKEIPADLRQQAIWEDEGVPTLEEEAGEEE